MFKGILWILPCCLILLWCFWALPWSSLFYCFHFIFYWCFNLSSACEVLQFLYFGSPAPAVALQSLKCFHLREESAAVICFFQSWKFVAVSLIRGDLIPPFKHWDIFSSKQTQCHFEADLSNQKKSTDETGTDAHLSLTQLSSTSTYLTPNCSSFHSTSPSCLHFPFP